jgi:hydrogenase 3 maturation protease
VGEEIGRLPEQWVNRLEDLFADPQGRLHVIGLGNPIKKDDGVGLWIVEKLRRKVSNLRVKKFVNVHPALLRPESLISRVVAEGHRALIVDAVEFDAVPGSILLDSLSGTKYGYFATHNIPIRLIPAVSKDSRLESAHVLGVQPLETDAGEGLTEPVSKSAQTIVNELERIISAREKAIGIV